MSHFYGTLQGHRGKATRCGSKASGIETVAASWDGAIEVHVWHDKETGKDCFTILQRPWHGRGINQDIAHGYLGEPIDKPAYPEGKQP